MLCAYLPGSMADSLLLFLRGRKACNINSVGFSVFWFNVNTRINFFYGLSLRQRANAWVNVHFLWTSGKCPKKEGKIIFLGQELENRKRYRNSSWKHSENCCFVRNSFFFSTQHWANDEKPGHNTHRNTGGQSKCTKCKFKLFTIIRPKLSLLFSRVCAVFYFVHGKNSGISIEQTP